VLRDFLVFVCPTVEYNSVICLPSTVCDIDALESVQASFFGLKSRKPCKIEPTSQLIILTGNHNYAGFRFVQKSMTLNDLDIQSPKKVICYGRNVRLMLVLLTYLFGMLRVYC